MSKQHYYVDPTDARVKYHCYGQSPDVVRAHAQQTADTIMQSVTVDYEVVHRDGRCTETGTALVCHPRKVVRAR